jgi:hypothetical protein
MNSHLLMTADAVAGEERRYRICEHRRLTMRQPSFSVTQAAAERLAAKLQDVYDVLPEDEKRVMTLVLSQAALQARIAGVQRQPLDNVGFVAIERIPWDYPELGTSGGRLVIPVRPPHELLDTILE